MQTPRSIVLRVIITTAGVLTALTILVSSTVTAAVALNYFSVIWNPSLEAVEIGWETATEFDTSGFQVERALSPNGTYTVPLNAEFEPAAGDQVTGWTYGPFFNMDVVTGTTYWYRLVVYDRSSLPDYGIPPVAVIAGNPNTPTPTNTPNTPTGGGAVPWTPTNTSTPTATPTRTPTLLFTPTPSSTPTRGPSPTRTPTAPAGATITPIFRATATNTPVSQGLTATGTAVTANVPPIGSSPTPILIGSPTESPVSSIAPLATPVPGQINPEPTLVPTNATVVAMAPVVIVPPTAPESAAPQGNRTLGLVALIGAAGLLLLGGLYIILRQTSK